MNWTEILRKAGVPEAPGYQELLEVIRGERLQQTVATVQPKRKRGKKKK